MSDRRVMLGKVTVESGQLLIIDPCSLDGAWQRESEAAPYALRFWGRDAPVVRDRLADHPVVDRIDTEDQGVFTLHPKPPQVAAEGVDPRPLVTAVLDSMAYGLMRMRDKEELFVRWELVSESSYQRVCRLTAGQARGGQLSQDQQRHLAVALLAGLGDGLYEVWATVRDFGEPWGERFTRVEVVLIEDADSPS